MAMSPWPVIITTGGAAGMAVTCARNSSPSMPGIFTSVTMHMASGRPGPRQGRLRGGEDLHRPPAQPQHLADGVPGRLVVVDHDDRRASPLVSSPSRFRPCQSRSALRARAAGCVNVAPAPGAPGGLDRALVVLDDGAGDGKAQAVAALARRVEGLEEPPRLLLA